MSSSPTRTSVGTRIAPRRSLASCSIAAARLSSERLGVLRPKIALGEPDQACDLIGVFLIKRRGDQPRKRFAREFRRRSSSPSGDP